MTTCPLCAADNVEGSLTCTTCGAYLLTGDATTTEMPAGATTAEYPAAPSVPAFVPGPPLVNPQPGPGWWLAADGHWYPPGAPSVSPPTTGWVQGADGQWYPQTALPYEMYPAYAYGYGYGPPKTKAVAALLAFFVGSTGAHNFYLGRTNTAVTQLCMLIVGFVTSLIIVGFFVLVALSIWVFIEFILILTGGIRDGQNRPLV